MIALARKTLVYEWRRFLPVVVSIGFSGVLLLVQAALVLGIFGSASLYVTASSGDLWVGYPGTQSVNFGRAVSPDLPMRLRMDPAVTAVEPYLWVDADWAAERSAGNVSVYVSGISTQRDAMMFSRLLSAELRERLREPGAVIVDPSDLDTLAVEPGGRAWINAHPVRVAGTLAGLRGLGGVNILTSLDTATAIGGRGVDDGATYYLARTADAAAARAAHDRLRRPDPRFGPYEVWTAQAFAERTQRYWLVDTGAGVAVLFMSIIVCAVGALITGQSLSAAIASSAREYATLNAMGVSRGTMVRVVLEQAAWLGGVGVVLAALAGTALLVVAHAHQVPVAMTPLVGLACVGVVAVLVLLSSVSAVRRQLDIEPAMLLR